MGHRHVCGIAAVEHPRDAIPLQGTWYGSASNYVAMQVAVRVKAALNDGTFMRSNSKLAGSIRFVRDGPKSDVYNP